MAWNIDPNTGMLVQSAGSSESGGGGSSGGGGIDFYECASVIPKSDGEPLYEHLITLSGNSEAGGEASSYGYGIYYPEDLSVEQSQRVYARKDGAYTLKVQLSDSNTGQIVLLDAAGNIKAATPYMALANIWDTWKDDGNCNLFYPDEAETAWEDMSMPYYWGNIAKWGNGNMFTISGAGTDSVNGFYVRGSGSIDYFSAGCYDSWINDNGTAAIYQIDDWIEEDDGDNIMGLLVINNGAKYEMPTADWDWDTAITSASQFANYTWRVVNGATPLPVLSDAEPEKTDPVEGSWSGYKMSQTADGAWTKADTLTEGLTVTYLTPKVGEIYSADTSIRVRKMYNGAVYPIPSDGLVFYAPLAADYVDQISGKAAPVTGGTFTTHNGLSCLQLDGSEYVKWADNADLAMGSSPLSMVILAAPTTGSDWRTFLYVGDKSTGVDMAAKNGRFQEWSGANISYDGTWQSMIVTRDDSGNGKAYINGALKGSGTTHVNSDLPVPSWVCVGAEPRVSYGYKVQGYIAFAAVYNRELSAEEVAEIHAVLMEDVEQ